MPQKPVSPKPPVCGCKKKKCCKKDCCENDFVFRKVVIPAALGDDETGKAKPENGAYTNSYVEYEANGAQYMYDSYGVYTKISQGEGGEGTLDFNELENRPKYAGEEMTGDTDIPSVEAETEARIAADATLQGNIDAEALIRQTADNGLQSQIDAITVSSDVKDVVGTKADLNNYDTSALGNNDIIKVLQDESENDATTYYRWNTATQQFTLIGEEGPYYTKSAADAKFQDKLTAGDNITIENNVISAASGAQSDWDENDSAEPSYIQNRPMYEEDIESDIERQEGYEAFNGGNNPVTGYVWYIQQVQDYSLASELTGFSDGDTIHAEYTYSVNGVEKTGGAEFILTLENDEASLDSDMPNTSPWNGAYAMEVSPNTTFRWPVETADDGATIYLTNVTYSRVKKLDARYIPVDGDTVRVNANGELEADVQGGPTVVQTTGASTTDVMSQKAVTNMIYPDGYETSKTRIAIGNTTITTGMNSVLAIGSNSSTTNYRTRVQGNSTVALGDSIQTSTGANQAVVIGTGNGTTGPRVARIGGIAIGAYANSGHDYSIALGHNALTSRIYELSVGSGGGTSATRFIANVTDPQLAQDAATKNYVDTQIVGTTETLTIASADWTALSASDPYDYSATVTATATISATSTVELINDQAVLFGTYGFAIGSVDTTNNTVTIYSIGQPSASVSLTIKVRS